MAKMEESNRAGARCTHLRIDVWGTQLYSVSEAGGSISICWNS